MLVSDDWNGAVYRITHGKRKWRRNKIAIARRQRVALCAPR
jgi:hypothetical protein